jgi:tetratricopeptide (TPR) repeat protein
LIEINSHQWRWDNIILNDMGSIIPGFEYDIFISYRQKDNKNDGWVTEFVKNLKGELESTFKEEVSVYFDTNPHDGLLETHDVYASLKDKLKCLVFIPIISRTYCDPKSFAWEHEFRAFVDLASHDQYGLKVKLPYGNVSNRVLPVSIHDLDRDDIKLCESVLGSPLRGVEFIYKEPGVNRSLTPKDDERKNINGTIYRNQINKVALAVKEIIRALKAKTELREPTDNHEVNPSGGINKTDKKRQKLKKGGFIIRKFLPATAVVALSLIAFIMIWQKFFAGDTINKLRSFGDRISVAVMPFLNMTNDSTLNIWQDGIQFNLIASISNSTYLKVRQTGSINNLLQSKGYANYATITPSVARSISRNLDADVFIYGNINRVGPKIRINTQLIDSKTEDIFQSFQLDGNESEILPLIDSISSQIKNYLIISVLRKEISPEFQTVFPKSAEAYKSFLLGHKAYFNGENLSAIKLFSDAVKTDSNFVYAYIWLSMAYANQGLYDQAKKWCIKAHDKSEELSFEFKIWVNWIYSRYVEKSAVEEIKFSRQLLEIDDHIPLTHFVVGCAYFELQQFSSAIPELEKTLEIYKSWNTKPLNSYFYEVTLIAYHATGMYKKEKELLKQAMMDFPEDQQITRRQIILSFCEGDTTSANLQIEQWKSSCRKDLWSEAEIIEGIASIYYDVGSFKEAEKYYRIALALEPENPARMNDLAYFLINKDINPAEGLKIIEEALKSDPGSYLFNETKGWGLFKLGKYNEALKLMEKSDSLKPVYSYDLSLQLLSVKQAIKQK